jgi:uncharacterized protein (TIGR00369 family)
MTDLGWVRSWIEGSPYAAALGVTVDDLSDTRLCLRLPYRHENTNPGRVLHGGVAASLVSISSQALARAALGVESGPWHTAGVQVTYLAAAVGEEVQATARLLKRGKELCFVDVEVGTSEGKPIARGLATLRGRFGVPDAVLCRAGGDDGAQDPGAMGPHISRTPFMGRLGLRVEHMQGGRSRLVLPWRDENADAGGGVHEGAVLALLDTTGAMAGWAETGPGRFKASTPAIQAQIVAPPPRTDLVAFGRMVQRDQELFLCDVEISAAGGVVARGTVIYRIVTEAS